MKESEIILLFTEIRSNYPNFERHKEKRETWVRLTTKAGLSFEQALENLDLHMMESEFEPKPANIIRLSHIKADPEAEARNIEIAFCKYVNEGGDPETYVYEPADGLGIGTTKKLGS